MAKTSELPQTISVSFVRQNEKTIMALYKRVLIE